MNAAELAALDRIEELLDRYVPMGEEPDRPVTVLREAHRRPHRGWVKRLRLLRHRWFIDETGRPACTRCPARLPTHH